MVDQLFLVFSYPAFELVHKSVDRSVHVFLCIVRVNRSAVHVYPCFRLMAQFLDREDTINIGNKNEVPLDFFDLGFDIASECIGNLDVVA